MNTLNTYLSENLLNRDAKKRIEDLDKENFKILRSHLIDATEEVGEYLEFSSLEMMLHRGRNRINAFLEAFETVPDGKLILDYIYTHFKTDMVWSDYEHVDDEDDELDANEDFLNELPTWTMSKAEIRKHLLNQKDYHYDVFKNVDGLDRANYAKLVYGGDNAEIHIIYDDGKAKSQEEKDLIFAVLANTV